MENKKFRKMVYFLLHVRGATRSVSSVWNIRSQSPEKNRCNFRKVLFSIYLQYQGMNIFVNPPVPSPIHNHKNLKKMVFYLHCDIRQCTKSLIYFDHSFATNKYFFWKGFFLFLVPLVMLLLTFNLSQVTNLLDLYFFHCVQVPDDIMHWM
jgi:hypothetical protein